MGWSDGREPDAWWLFCSLMQCAAGKALFDWCEENYRYSDSVAEFFNTSATLPVLQPCITPYSLEGILARCLQHRVACIR